MTLVSRFFIFKHKYFFPRTHTVHEKNNKKIPFNKKQFFPVLRFEAMTMTHVLCTAKPLFFFNRKWVNFVQFPVVCT
jgi:hypothetical protein